MLFFRYSNNQTLTAQWRYKAKHRDEININKGQVVTFIRQDANNKDWLVVKTRRGIIGRVPGPYFRLTKSVANTNGKNADSRIKSKKCKTGNNKRQKSQSPQRVGIRTRIMQELIETEQVSIHTRKCNVDRYSALFTHIIIHNQQYNKKLMILMNDYKNPLEARLNEQPLLEQTEIDLLFKSIPIILTMSAAFLSGLKHAKYKNIGKLFIVFAPSLRAYSPFLGSFMAGIRALQALNKDKSRKSKWLEFLVGVTFYSSLIDRYELGQNCQISSTKTLNPNKQTNRRRGHTI